LVGPNLYVGGEFTDAAGLEAGDHIARWGTVYKYVYLPLVTRLH
jgi:hypothetical protein